jgi:hypothetical protein
LAAISGPAEFTVSFLVYDCRMHDPPRSAPSSAAHDKSLLEWFATLSPGQRLAKLELRKNLMLVIVAPRAPR